MKTIIIAEAGVNHNGDMSIAKKLIDAAAEAGADFVKFQTFKAEALVTKTAVKAKYQTDNTGNNDSQFAMLKHLELSDENHYELINYCKEKKIKFLSTPFEVASAKFLEDKVVLWKIPSGELTNFPFIKFLASKEKPIILSTGMATAEEVQETVNFIKKCWKEKNINFEKDIVVEGLEIPMISVLHCTTAYPTPYEQVNLNVMATLRNDLKLKVGYSDHTLGIEVPVAATALGAAIIEKHFTLDRSMPGPDHKASLEPVELKQMITSIRHIETALGSAVKAPTEAEIMNITVARKSLCYARCLPRGHVISENDIITKRPGNGLAPKYFDSILGKKLLLDVFEDQVISPEDFIE